MNVVRKLAYGILTLLGLIALITLVAIISALGASGNHFTSFDFVVGISAMILPILGFKGLFSNKKFSEESAVYKILLISALLGIVVLILYMGIFSLVGT